MEEFLKKYQKVEVKEYPNIVKQEPLVSVCVVTYNHVNYIKDCLDGILMQKADFDYEILLGEDESRDGTREISIDYAEKYPDKIRLFLHSRENNIKINGHPTGRFNFLYNSSKARGKYIALCEGDDYWTDTYKLQKQVDFLEANPEYGMVHTDADQYDTRSGRIIRGYHQNNKISHNDENAFEEILKSNYPVFTCTTLFRRELLNSIDFSEARNFKMGDTFLWLEIAKKSKIKYFAESTAVRQVLRESATQSNNWNKKLHFKKSGYDLMKYFINKYGASKKTEIMVHEKFNRVILNFAYRADRKKDAVAAYYKLKQMGSVNFIDKLYFWGCMGSARRIIAGILINGQKVLKKLGVKLR